MVLAQVDHLAGRIVVVKQDLGLGIVTFWQLMVPDMPKAIDPGTKAFPPAALAGLGLWRHYRGAQGLAALIARRLRLDKKPQHWFALTFLVEN
ncbi:hypothetical protein [Fodinicurvata sp. EGI_FJ10296]|uniref:hypothetical protein n=1 Tax=Fodinicurvata sp. EGI_FJ10296 TaxID=3231908 RepID=UPI0034539B34